jgi:hypothetical protein
MLTMSEYVCRGQISGKSFEEVVKCGRELIQWLVCDSKVQKAVCLWEIESLSPSGMLLFPFFFL